MSNYNLILSSCACSKFELDAVFQEANLLKSKLNGTIQNIYPIKKPLRFLPLALYKKSIPKEIDKDTSVNIVFHPTLKRIPIISRLKGKIVYNVSSSAWLKKPKDQDYLNKFINLIVVNNAKDYDVVKKELDVPVKMIIPGVDCKNITKTKKDFDGTLNILIASAPWTANQIKTKGILNLFKVVQRREDVKVTLLLRGILETEHRKLIKNLGIEHKVKLVNEFVNIHDYLKVHDLVFLVAEKLGIVKAIPHSLVEATFNGTAILTNETISFSSVVKENNLGPVINQVSVQSISDALDDVILHYDSYKDSAMKFDAEIYKKDRYLNDVEYLVNTL